MAPPRGSKAQPKEDEEYVDDETATTSRVEVRVDGRIVYAQALYGLGITPSRTGLAIKGTVERPQVKVTKAPPKEYTYQDPRDDTQVIEQFHDGSRV